MLQSECSAYTLSTNMNSDNLVNFQQRFSHFNPEIQTPHLFNTNLVCGQSVNCDNNLCDQNHNAVQNYKNEPFGAHIWGTKTVTNQQEQKPEVRVFAPIKFPRLGFLLSLSFGLPWGAQGHPRTSVWGSLEFRDNEILESRFQG